MLAVLTAHSLVLFVLESLLPLPMPAPGAKLGLCNVVTLFMLYNLPRASDALIVIALRCTLSAALFGGPSVFVYGAAGAAASFCVMLGLKKSRAFSLVGVSAAGGFFHNAAQLAVASWIASSLSMWNYLPVLGAAGIISGVCTGFLCGELQKKLPPNLLNRLAHTPRR